MNLARFLTVYADLCASVRVILVGVAVGVLGPNAPRGNRAGDTYSLAEGVPGLFTSNEPRGSRADAAFGVEKPRVKQLLRYSTPLSLGS